MKFHVPSFLLGFGTAAALIGARAALRPVLVELAALGIHFGRIGRAVVERQRENLEDLFAEIEENARRKSRGTRRPEARVEKAAAVETH